MSQNQTRLSLVRNDQGDWAGIYLDGRLVYQNHSLTPEEVLDTLGIPYVRISDVAIPWEIGSFPEDVNDISSGHIEECNQQ